MKAKCIRNDEWQDCLTIGKSYEVLYETKFSNNYSEIFIKDDYGYKFWFDKERFVLEN